MMTVVFGGLGVALITQPGRFALAPSFNVILQLLPACAWGGMYLIVALLLLASIVARHRFTILVIAHTVALAMVAAWEAIFLTEYVMPGSRTVIVYSLSWAVFILMLTQSASTLGHERDRPADLPLTWPAP